MRQSGSLAPASLAGCTPLAMCRGASVNWVTLENHITSLSLSGFPGKLEGLD